MKTYRYLRLGVVGLAIALAASLVIEVVLGEGEGERLLDSISAYYYTPVRGVFVGVLVASGLALVAIKGRQGAEDILLNLAGMLAPVVALVPTPISRPIYGLSPDSRAVPAPLVPYVENNVGAMLVLGVLGLLVAVRSLPVDAARPAALRGLTAGWLLWLGTLAWFLVGRESFLEVGHYVAAVAMFGCLAAVATLNAVRVVERSVDEVRWLSPRAFRTLYGGVAAGMAAVLVVAVGIFLVESLLSVSGPGPWLFWVEALLLALFAVFWVAQTLENWDLGSPAC